MESDDNNIYKPTGLTLAEKLRRINRRILNKKFNILDDRRKACMQLAKIRWGTNLPISRPKPNKKFSKVPAHGRRIDRR